MKKIYSLILVLSFLFGANLPVFAWGDDGHRAVGAQAAVYLKPQTLNRINRVLLGDSIAGVASWADWVKYRPDDVDLDPETEQFLALDKNDKNDTWHYVDLPLDCQNYDSCEGFKRQDDIVQMINFSIRRLKTRKEDSQHPISERNALRLLIHLIGDLHQPLHVGAGFVNAQDQNNFIIETDPQRIRQFKFTDDQGGNLLVFSWRPVNARTPEEQRDGNLHSFWDTEVVQRLMFAAKKTRTPETFGRFLKDSIKPESNWNAQGADIYNWAAQWATDSKEQSKKFVYPGVKITGKRERESRGRTVTEYLISRGDVSQYDRRAEEAARIQLAKAGYRLAQLLEDIY